MKTINLLSNIIQVQNNEGTKINYITTSNFCVHPYNFAICSDCRNYNKKSKNPSTWCFDFNKIDGEEDFPIYGHREDIRCFSTYNKAKEYVENEKHNIEENIIEENTIEKNTYKFSVAYLDHGKFDCGFIYNIPNNIYKSLVEEELEFSDIEDKYREKELKKEDDFDFLVDEGMGELIIFQYNIENSCVEC